MSVFQETSTDASRILYIDSRFGENINFDKQITTDFLLQLQDPIVVPNHHAILLSLHRLNVPRTFYNFKRLKNAGVEIMFESAGGGNGVGFGNGYAQLPYLTFEIPDGNWNAISLMNYIETVVNNYLELGVSRYSSKDIDAGQRGIFEFNMRYNPDTMKYSFRIQPKLIAERAKDNVNDIRITFRWLSGLQYGSDPFTVLPAGAYHPDANIRNAFGFIKNRWIDGDIKDFYVEFVGDAGATINDPSGLGWNGGQGRAPEDNSAWGTDIRTISLLTPTNIGDNLDFWEGSNNGATDNRTGVNNYFSCVDVNYHSGNLYLHTNLSSNAVIDSKLGCRYSDILARVPVSNVPFGSIVVVEPSDGGEHKVILKVREITQIRLSLRDIDDTPIDLNGLDWNCSLKFDFIEVPQIEVLKDKRLSIEEIKYKNFMEKTEGVKTTKSKVKELKELKKQEGKD